MLVQVCREFFKRPTESNQQVAVFIILSDMALMGCAADIDGQRVRAAYHAITHIVVAVHSRPLNRGEWRRPKEFPGRVYSPEPRGPFIKTRPGKGCSFR